MYKGKKQSASPLETVFEEMKAKAKQALECEENTGIYARRKIEVESVFVFGHIKGNRSLSMREGDQMHTEFGIVASAHHLLKRTGIR